MGWPQPPILEFPTPDYGENVENNDNSMNENTQDQINKNMEKGKGVMENGKQVVDESCYFDQIDLDDNSENDFDSDKSSGREDETSIVFKQIMKIVKKNGDRAVHCILIKSNDWKFEIDFSDGSRHTVDLHAHTCSYRLWDLTGIPCKHGVSAIEALIEDPEDYVLDCYSIETYCKVYEAPINPMSGPIECCNIIVQESWNKEKLVLG